MDKGTELKGKIGHVNVDEIEDLLIEFDEMGFEPTTLCENPQREIETFRNRLKQALTEKQDLERFIRLVVEKNLVIAVIEFYAFNRNYEKNIALKVYNSTVNKEQELTEEEFDFIKEMIKKYGKRI